jgi:hypothetical protein
VKPSSVLGLVLIVLGLVTVPIALLAMLSVDERSLPVVLAVVLGYPAAILIWLSARKAAATRRAWILAGLGTALVAAVSYQPINGLVQIMYGV